MPHFPELELSISSSGEKDRLDLRLRPWSENDIPAVVRACADPLTQQWLPLPMPYTREDAARFIAVCATARLSGDGITRAITLGRSGAVVGCVGLRHTDWQAHVTEVGYWAVPEYRGRGYITVATRALSEWALQQEMERVELLAPPDNVASNRVALAAGFGFAGLQRTAGFIHAGRVDLNLYAMTRRD